MPPNGTAIDENVRIGINASEVNRDLKSVKKGIDDVNDAFSAVAKQVDAVITSIQNLAAVTANVRQTVNKTINNANTYTTNQNITRVSAGGRGKQSAKMGNAVYTVDSSDNSAYANDIRKKAVDYAKQEAEFEKQRLETEKEITNLKKQQANLTGEKAKSYAQDSATRKTNADANLLNAQTRAAHPELFAAGALNRSWRYQTGRGIQGVGNAVSSLGTGGQIVGGALNILSNTIKSPALGFATLLTEAGKALSDFSKAAVTAYAEIESTKTNLGVVFSSQTQADTAFGQLADHAVKSPFGVQQTSELAILLKQSGVYASDLMDTLKMLGDTAGGNMEKMKRIANNYAQIVSIGKASMLDMRQFAYAGIPIFEAVSKELGVSQQELRKLISDGKVTSDIIEKVFKDLTGINGVFENATEKGAKTLKARLQNLSDAKQLAMSEVGSLFVNAGTRTGNDGFGMTLVGWAEKIWQTLYDRTNTKNIEKSVKAIETRNKDIGTLEKLIDSYKAQGKDIKYLEKSLEQLKQKIDPDAERAAYVAMYKSLVSGKFSKDELQRTSKDVNQEIRDLQAQQKSIGANYYHDGSPYLALEGTKERMEQDALQLQIDHLKALAKEISNFSKIFYEILNAVRENNTIDAQQLAFDQTNKYADTSGSLGSSFQELSSIYRNSEEYTKKQEEEHLKVLRSALEELKFIKENTDDKGNIDFTKFSDENLLRLNRLGAFNGAEKLTITTNKSAAEKSENRQLLMSQLGSVISKNQTFLEYISRQNPLSGYENYNKIMSLVDSLNAMSNGDFYNNFASYFDRISESLDKLKTSGTAGKIEDIKELMGLSTLRLTTDTSGSDVNPEDLSKGAESIFIPLWKRILAQYTGISAQYIEKTGDVLTTYQDKLSSRNTASSVLGAALRSGKGSDIVQQLLSPSGAYRKNQGDYDNTFQVDWDTARKNVKEFALSLSASTDVIDSYVNSLNEQKETYYSLLTAALTQGEEQDTVSKIVSDKKFQQLAQVMNEQQINAFGERLSTADNNDVYAEKQQDGSFKFYEDAGKTRELSSEQVRITGNLFDFIKQILPNLSADIAEATLAASNNKILKNIYDELKPTLLTTGMLLNGMTGKARIFASENTGYVEDQLNSIFNLLQDYRTNLLNERNAPDENEKKDASVKRTEAEDALSKLFGARWMSVKELAEKTEAGSLSDATLKSYESSEAGESWRKLLDYMFAAITGKINDFINSDEYKTASSLSNKKAHDDELNAAYVKYLKYYDKGEDGYTARERERQGSPNQWGWQGVGSYLLGNENAFTNKSFYNQIAIDYLKEKKAKKEGIDISDIEDADVTKEEKDPYDSLSMIEKMSLKLRASWIDIEDSIVNCADKLKDALKQAAQGAFLAPFEALGASLIKGDKAAEDLKANMTQIAADLLKNVGSAMAEAGFSLVALGARKGSFSTIMAGLALAAAGGFASGLGGALTETQKETDDDDDAKRAEKLKSDLADLLEQARKDAIYYEKNLRHKTALGINERFSYTSVNDAILTPRGDIVTTDPRDYIIATKTPQTLIGGGPQVFQPVINSTVINNAPVQVRQETKDNGGGDFELVTIIEQVTGDYISSSRSDLAFAARQARSAGRQAVM